MQNINTNTETLVGSFRITTSARHQRLGVRGSLMPESGLKSALLFRLARLNMEGSDPYTILSTRDRGMVGPFFYISIKRLECNNNAWLALSLTSLTASCFFVFAIVSPSDYPVSTWPLTCL